MMIKFYKVKILISKARHYKKSTKQKEAVNTGRHVSNIFMLQQNYQTSFRSSYLFMQGELYLYSPFKFPFLTNYLSIFKMIINVHKIYHFYQVNLELLTIKFIIYTSILIIILYVLSKIKMT